MSAGGSERRSMTTSSMRLQLGRAARREGRRLRRFRCSACMPGRLPFGRSLSRKASTMRIAPIATAQIPPTGQPAHSCNSSVAGRNGSSQTPALSEQRCRDVSPLPLRHPRPRRRLSAAAARRSPSMVIAPSAVASAIVRRPAPRAAIVAASMEITASGATDPSGSTSARPSCTRRSAEVSPIRSS